VLENNIAYTVAADLAQVLMEMGGSSDSDHLYIREVIVPELRFDETSGDLHAIEFQDSVVGTLAIAPDFPVERLPTFVRTHFGEVEGRVGAGDMPANRFVDCDYDAFEEPARTTNAIMSLGLPLGTKVMLTVLKKLYAQKGSGRKEAAFYRGLDARAQSPRDTRRFKRQLKPGHHGLDFQARLAPQGSRVARPAQRASGLDRALGRAENRVCVMAWRIRRWEGDGRNQFAGRRSHDYRSLSRVVGR
jgi:hypothetical protein